MKEHKNLVTQELNDTQEIPVSQCFASDTEQ